MYVNARLYGRFTYVMLIFQEYSHEGFSYTDRQREILSITTRVCI